MTTISAEVVLHSKHAQTGHELFTILWRYPRFIHAEVMTHRQFSRNASSSRAIPVSKLIDSVIHDPVVPMFWGKNQPGMQAGEEHAEKVRVWKRTAHTGAVPFMLTNEEAWLHARDQAVEMAQWFAEAGYHKQIVNRLLEPFSHITVVVSATQWSNFFALRDHPDAEPHIRLLTQRTKAAMQASVPQILRPGEWHLPFVNLTDEHEEPVACSGDTITNAHKLSVARCASTSYKTVDGFDMTVERAVALYDKLAGSAPIHASPFEHVAQADEWWFENDGWQVPEQHGNFVGFRQLRKMLPGECQ